MMTSLAAYVLLPLAAIVFGLLAWQHWRVTQQPSPTAIVTCVAAPSPMDTRPTDLCTCVTPESWSESVDCMVCGMGIPGREIQCPTCRGSKIGEVLASRTSTSTGLPYFDVVDCPHCDGEGWISSPAVTYRWYKIRRQYLGDTREDAWTAEHVSYSGSGEDFHDPRYANGKTFEDVCDQIDEIEVELEADPSLRPVIAYGVKL